MLRIEYLIITIICTLSLYESQVNSQHDRRAALRYRFNNARRAEPTTTNANEMLTVKPTSSEDSNSNVTSASNVTNASGNVTAGSANGTAGNDTETLYYDSESDDGKKTTPSTTTRTRRAAISEDSADKYQDRSDEAWYLKFRDRHNLPEPFQLPGRKRLVDLEDMAHCRCPRVYWPVCALNGITYLNYCIMICLGQEIRRYGPCINYRRAGQKARGFLSDQ